MPRSPAPLVLLCLGLLLVIWPLTLQKPGLPLGLKADEPAYYLMARSLWEDRDLVCEAKDLDRLHDEFLLDAQNLILMTRDGWRTVHFGKPYFGSLLVAPAVALFGANGFVAANMAMLLLAVVLGFLHLRQRNPEGESLLFAIGYFLVSACYLYAFWLQPEISSLASVALALFFSLQDFSLPSGQPGAAARWWRRILGSIFNNRTRWLWAGLALAPAANAKPVYAAALLPGIVANLRPSLAHLRALATLLFAFGLGTIAIAAGQHALTGTWSAYLGVERRGFNVRDPSQPPWEAQASALAPAAGTSGLPASAAAPSTAGSWSWILAWPGIDSRRLPQDLRNYFIGRHTGAFVYFPFLLVSLLLFVTGGGWRRRERMALLAGLVVFVAFFLIWNNHNYHGGAGFVGNRYLVGLYPAGLFLVERLRPRLLPALGFALGGAFLGQVLFAPLGPPVAQPTLQAYARAVPFRWLPYEFTLPRQIPGYLGVSQGGAYIRGRKDLVSRDGDWITLEGQSATDLFFVRTTQAASAAFLLRSYAPGNVVSLRLGASRESVRFPDGPPPEGGVSRLAILHLYEPDERFQEWSGVPEESIWYLHIHSQESARPSWWGRRGDALVGVQLLHVGEREVLERDVYGVEWVRIEAPAEVPAGERFQVQARLRNHSAETWVLDSPVAVNVSYRWRAAGSVVVAEGLRTSLPAALAPGEEAALAVTVLAPEAAGQYTLVLEPVYEYVRWFGDLDPQARTEIEVCVAPAADRG